MSASADRSFRLLSGLVPAALALACFATTARADDKAPKAKAVDRLVGTAIADFALDDVATGRAVRLHDFSDKKAVVVVFTGTDCPVGNLYMPRLVELAERTKDHGVAFVAVNSNASESAEAIAAHAREYKLSFPVLRDQEGRVAAQLDAERTCEALVIDGQGVLRYRGAIDNQYGYGTRRDQASKNYLSDAIDAVLAGKEPETNASTVVGCPLERPDGPKARPIARVRAPLDSMIEAIDAIEPEVDPATLGSVNYAQHVAPIVQAKCQACHRPGQVGPFALLTFDDAKRHADGIVEAIEARRMPPWHADPRYGHFANDRRLSPRERATLIAWAEQGSPQGDTSCEPAPKAWPEGWTIGTPDVVFQMPKPFIVKAEGALPYQRFRVKTNFNEDKWVQAMEPRPGDRSVVHHVVIYMIEPGKKVRDFDDLEHLAAYAPGDLPTRLPEGVAKRIPKGAELLFEIHYTPTGKVRIDQSSVGLVFAKEPPKYRAITFGIADSRLRIPAGADNAPSNKTRRMRQDVQIVGFLPHMHLRGKDFKYTARYPDGREEVLLSVPRYDFAWQSYYWLAEPKALPKGTQVVCEAHFDNSASNAALSESDIQQDVRWGEQTWEEMMIGYMDVVLPVAEEPVAEGDND